MDQQQLVTLIGQGSGWAALVWVIYKIGLKMIAAIDRNTQKLEEHTTQDLAAMADVREDLAALGARIDTALDLTPIRGVKKYERPQSQPGAGYYGPRKPPREDG